MAGNRIPFSSRKLLSAVLQALPVGVRVLDENGDLVCVNPAMKDIWHGENESPADRMDRMEIEALDGTRKVILHSATTLTNSKGSVQASVASTIDITELARARQVLEVTESRLDLALRYSPAFLFTHDKKLRYTWVHNVPGSVPAVMLGKTDIEIFPENEAVELTKIKQSVLESGVASDELVKLTIDGAEAWHELCVQPITDASGKTSGLSCASMDVMYGMKIDGRVRTSARRLHQLVTDSTLPLLLVDRAGIIRQASPPAAAALGYSPGELTGLRIIQLVDVPDLAPLISLSGELFNGKRPVFSTMSCWSRADGQQVWMEMNAILGTAGFSGDTSLLRLDPVGPVPKKRMFNHSQQNPGLASSRQE